MSRRVAKMRAALWGALYADALGVPHEFKRASEIPEVVSMVMPASYAKTYPSVPYGTWSDDGALMLALADAMVKESDARIVERFAEHALAWRRAGAYTPDGVVFDIGTTTAKALDRLARGVPAARAGEAGETSNGNGSLMRTLPIGLIRRKPHEVAALARSVSQVTHAHVTSLDACALYSVAAKMLLNDFKPTLVFEEASHAIGVLFELPTPSGSGYVVDSLAFAVKAIAEGWSYTATVRKAIALGGDTDTTAMIAGGLAALRDGRNEFAFDELRGREIAEPIIEAFVAKFA